MPIYRYRALSNAGQVVSGELSANTHSVAISMIQELGYLPISAVPATGISVDSWRGLFSRKKELGQTDVALFTQQLSTLIGAGLTLERALLVIAQSATDESKLKVIESLVGSVRAGSPLWQAITPLGETFPDFYRNTLRAAEEGGFLAAGLQRLADYVSKTRALRDTIKSALIYPTILLVMASASVLLVLTVVLPQFRPLFTEAKVQLPFLAAAVMATSGFLVDYPFAALALIGVFVVLGAIAYKNIRNQRGASWLDRISLRLPMIRDIIIRFEVARFTYALGLLLENGTALPTSLSLASKIVRNHALTAITESAAVKVKEGKHLADALAVKPFPVTAIELIRVGEETGQLPNALTRIAELFDQEAQQSLNRAISLLVPALTVILGVVVALLVTSIFSALISINQVVI